MTKSLKKEFYKKTKEEFAKYLDEVQNSEDSLVFLIGNKKYFFKYDNDMFNCLSAINYCDWKLNSLFASLSDFAKKQNIQSFLIDEIYSTNSVESIYSTKHDIFSIINKYADSSNKKIISITNAYKLLLNGLNINITNHNDIRDIYNMITTNSIDEEDIPDGKFYRKNEVYINDGLKNVHKGLNNEDEIIESMEYYISLFNDLSINKYERQLLAHFILETIHPFYDANGRLGRFLLSYGLYQEDQSITSIVVSSIINKNKSKYYKALESGRDNHEFGCLNNYVFLMCEILTAGIKEIEIDIEKKIKIVKCTNNTNLTKSENAIFNILKEAYLFSFDGISIDEIISNTNSSRRTVLYVLKNLKGKDLIIETKIGKRKLFKIDVEKLSIQ